MKSVSIWIIFSLIYSTAFGVQHGTRDFTILEDLKQKYPNAIIKEVTLDEYYLIKQNLKDAGKKYYNLPKRQFLVASKDLKKDATSDEPQEAPSYEESRHAPNFNVRASVDIFDGMDSMDGDGAVIIFVVIAVFAVVALAFYAGKYIYDVVNYKGDSYGYWYETSLFSSSIMSRVEEGNLIGAKLATGFKDEGTHVGLAIEFGTLDVKFNLEDQDDEKGENIDVKGSYILMGPTIRWHFDSTLNATYYYIDLLAGSTEHKEVGVMSIARTGYNFGIFDNLRLGISIGSMYLNLKESEGLIRNDNDFNMIGSVETGLRF